MASWRDRVPVRLRAFFRGVFLLLALATIALALSVLQEEKQLSYRGYRDLFGKSVECTEKRVWTVPAHFINSSSAGCTASAQMP